MACKPPRDILAQTTRCDFASRPKSRILRSPKLKGSHVHYEQQKAMQRELNERIPPAAKGDPQNELRHVVNSQRLSGKSFDQSVDFALSVIRKRYPQFTPRILPPRKELVRAANA